MREPSVGQALLNQVEGIARGHRVTRVERILLKVGPGVGPWLRWIQDELAA